MLGAVPGLPPWAMSPATPGVSQAAPQGPPPLAVMHLCCSPGCSLLRPNTVTSADKQPDIRVPNSETVPGGGGDSYAQRVPGQERAPLPAGRG